MYTSRKKKKRTIVCGKLREREIYRTVISIKIPAVWM